MRTRVKRSDIVEVGWKAKPKRVKVPYTNWSGAGGDPEYHRTRGIRWEAGGTTPQG